MAAKGTAPRCESIDSASLKDCGIVTEDLGRDVRAMFRARGRISAKRPCKGPDKMTGYVRGNQKVALECMTIFSHLNRKVAPSLQATFSRFLSLKAPVRPSLPPIGSLEKVQSADPR